MSATNRLLRRLPFYRFLRLNYLLGWRKGQRKEAWRHTEVVLMAIGNMTIIWAGISLMLNNLIEWYQAQVGTVIREDLPRDFTRKLEYLRAMESDIRWSAEDREKLRKIRLELTRMNEFRVNIVHGMLWREGELGVNWTAVIAKEAGARLDRRNVRYSRQQIFDHVRAMSETSAEMSPFFARLVGLPHAGKR